MRTEEENASILPEGPSPPAWLGSGHTAGRVLAELARLPASPARPVCELAQTWGADQSCRRNRKSFLGWGGVRPAARSVAATWGRKRFWLVLSQSRSVSGVSWWRGLGGHIGCVTYTSTAQGPRSPA